VPDGRLSAVWSRSDEAFLSSESNHAASAFGSSLRAVGAVERAKANRQPATKQAPAALTLAHFFALSFFLLVLIAALLYRLPVLVTSALTASWVSYLSPMMIPAAAR
jgi:hypothetical protein